MLSFQLINVLFFSDCAADEFECEFEFFGGSYTNCLGYEWKCNGVRDCNNIDDEANCEKRRGFGAKKGKNWMLCCK